MADKYSTIQQHQPLRVPASFDAQGKALIVQLDEVFDDVYRRFGRLRFEDFGEAFQKRLQDDEGNIASITIEIGDIEIALEDKYGKVNGISITNQGIEIKSQHGEKKILLESGEPDDEGYSKIELTPEMIDMITTGLVRLFGNSSSRIRFYDSGTEEEGPQQIFAVDADNGGVTGQKAYFEELNATTAKFVSLEVGNLMSNNTNVPNIVYSQTDPRSDPSADIHNTLWLKPQASQTTGGSFSDTAKTKAASEHSCTQSGTTFKYTVGLSANVDLTDVTSLELKDVTLTRNGADQGTAFTVTAEVKCSDGSTIDLGTVLSQGTSFGTYNVKTDNPVSCSSSKTATGVIYSLTFTTGFDAMAHYSSFSAGKLKYSGTHSGNVPSEVCEVHYIP